MEPVGVFRKNDSVNPVAKAISEIRTLTNITDLNFLDTCITDRVGNTIKLEINNDPINRMPKTTTIEHITAIIILYIFVLMPMDLAYNSSNVIANILLYVHIYRMITKTVRIIVIKSSFSPIERILPNK